MNRIADLTWKHPKLVLAAVGVFALLAIAFGRDVEQHLKAAGFTDPSSESERASTLLRDSLGYDPNPGADRGRARARRRPARTSPTRLVRREVGRLSDEMAEVEYVGRVVNPLRDRRAARTLVARDGESLTIAGYLSTDDIQDAGGFAAEDVSTLLAASPLDTAMGGYAAGFNETNDQTREDLTKAELIAFPILALLLLFVFRGVVAAAIPLLLGVISIVGTLFVLRVMSTFADTSLFALNIATGLSLGLAVDYALLLVSRYREEIASGGATREAHRRTVQTAGRTAVFSGLTVAAAMAALVLMPQRFLYSMAVAGASVAVLSALIGDPRRALAAGAAGDPHRHALDPPRPGRLRHFRRLVPARPRGDAAPGRGRPGQLGAAAGLRGAAAVDDTDRTRAPKRCRRANPPTTPTATSTRTTRATSPRR